MKLTSILAASTAAFALFAANPAFAHPDGHTDTASAELPSGPEGPALWKVSDEDTTIYLFGTVHVLPKDLVWYDAEIDAALKASDTVVTEIAMDAASEAALGQVAQQKGSLPEGTTLRSLFTPEQTAKYEAALGGIGIPAAALDGQKPWLAALTLTTVPLLQQGYDPSAGVDKVILTKAGDKEKGSLETAEFQLGIFDSLPQEKQIEFLFSAIDEIPNAGEALGELVDEWVEGDADGLAVLMNESLEDSDIADALLYNRNANWADWIDTRLDTPGTVFIAVGAGHLAGERSVQDYLADHDIETTRIQ